MTLLQYRLPVPHQLHRSSAYLGTVFLMLAAGCASVDSVRDAPESSGEERLYNVGYSRMVELIATTLASTGLENVDQQSTDPRITVFIGTSGVKLTSWGEIVRVTVTEIDPTNTSVRVHWRHRFRDGLISLAPDWRKKIFAGIEERLP
jgi:hypothetical protein